MGLVKRTSRQTLSPEVVVRNGRPAGKYASPPHVTDAGESEFDTYQAADRLYHAAIASFTFGISPLSLLQAWQDWALHLSISPGTQQRIVRKYFRKQVKLATYVASCLSKGSAAERCIEPLPTDRRFKAAGWAKWPFNLYAQSFLLSQQWWHNATTDVPGVTRQHERLVEFYSRQILDMLSPGNFVLTNPEVLEQTVKERGANLGRGIAFLASDVLKLPNITAESTSAYEPGRNLAVTKGKVVYRNELIELIQYDALTDLVHKEPVVIVPAWIMKYYILDLSPENSFVRNLVSQGFTVFCISWINPDKRYRETGFEDYLKMGVMDALGAVEDITGSRQFHAAGYCLGGTLLAVAAAAMARDGDTRLKSLTMLAAQVDFSDPGELGLFIDESQLSFLEDIMWQRGYLESWQMAGAFQMLRSQDLIWSRLVREYLLGRHRSPNDLMAWNSDSTRMPYRMHSEYLRGFYLNNDLARGRFRAGGHTVHLEDVHVPVFAVGTLSDHVAPWKSVFNLIHLFDTDVDFILTSGGHNAGIVSEPGHPGRSYRTLTYKHGDPHPSASEWLDRAEARNGSWWPEWTCWLSRNSSGNDPARKVGNPEQGYPPLCDAPGTYVRMK